MIRRVGPADWPAIAALCADTGRQGEPVDAEERDAFGEHWIGPYRVLRPAWTFVAVVDGAVVGYLTGCPDTLQFDKERRRVMRPAPDSRELFSEDVRLKLWIEHPAHLHMNVSDGFRRLGIGGGLIREFFAALRQAGVPSTHVICGPTAAPAWTRMGFHLEATVEAAPGIVVSALTRPVAA